MNNNSCEHYCELKSELAEKKWLFKLGLYQRYYQYGYLLNEVHEPAISIIIVAWRRQSIIFEAFRKTKKYKIRIDIRKQWRRGERIHRIRTVYRYLY